MDVKGLDFNHKTVWVTGAYQGIGRAIALSFAALGARVVGFDKQFNDDVFQDDFRQVRLDVSNKEAIQQTMQNVLRDQENRLDVLVNAAGILHMGNVETVTTEAWEETFTVNVTGIFHILKEVVPHFKAQRHGALINIGSNAAHVPRPSMVAYSASKAALTALSQSIALELAPYGVRCNLVSPGSTDTPMQRSMWHTADDTGKVVAGAPEQYRLGIPLGKLATPSDIVNIVVFLASDLAGHITLQDVVVDGGATLGS